MESKNGVSAANKLLDTDKVDILSVMIGDNAQPLVLLVTKRNETKRNETKRAACCIMGR